MGSGVKCGRTARGAAHWDEAASSADLGRPTAPRAVGWVAGQAEHCMCRANSRSMHAGPTVSVGDTIQSSGGAAGFLVGVVAAGGGVFGETERFCFCRASFS